MLQASAFAVATGVASLLPLPRLRRSPPACPRTVRLRRFAPCRTVRPTNGTKPIGSRVSRASRRSCGVVFAVCVWRTRVSAPTQARSLLLPLSRFRRDPPACPRTVRLRRFAPCRTVRPKSSIESSGEKIQLARGTLNRYLLILKRSIFESSVRDGSPSFVAAPNGPETRP